MPPPQLFVFRRRTVARSPKHLIVPVILIVVLAILVQYQILTIAFEKLGLSAQAAYLLLIVTLAGSIFNIPLFTINSNFSGDSNWSKEMLAWAQRRRYLFPCKTLILVNVGGCVVPVAFSVYLFLSNDVPIIQSVTCVTAVSIVAFAVSRPVRGLGIGMPILFAPLTAAGVAYALAQENAAPLAYIGGTLGVLIGADLLRLRDVRKLGSPVASIGGAGSFDGIFISGLLAVLLA
ncbi:MAG: DUF1614 domain-containing protein [Betaproteobacteria bacterium]|nr:MAG: DUF1614 domain-containing protein [Betaproteobacteria bacterium]